MSITLYHVSRRANRDSIAALGLEPRNSEFSNIARQPGIYMFEAMEQARDWAFWFAMDEHTQADLWEVRLPSSYALEPETHPEMTDIYDAWIGYAPIPPEALHVVFTQPVPRSTAEAPPLATKKSSVEESCSWAPSP